MKLRTPRRWYVRDGRQTAILDALARPLSWVWASITAGRRARGRPIDPGAPVICVGNLTLGGAGKTPVVRELTRRLRARGLQTHILTRGHGGLLRGPVQVDPARHTATDVGDEALMMAGDAPVWIARDRAAGARAAVAAGAEVIVMDDGYQNPSVAKALSLLVVDGETRDNEWPFGNGAVFPGGPMREPLATGLQRADAVVILLPADLATANEELLGLFDGKPVLIAHLSPGAAPPAGPQVGFAGIGKPWKMERALRAAGCDLVEFTPLADHQRLGEHELRSLEDRARELGAGMITSEKDWARLPPKWRTRVVAWLVRAVFDDSSALEALLAPVLGRVRPV